MKYWISSFVHFKNLFIWTYSERIDTTLPHSSLCYRHCTGHVWKKYKLSLTSNWLYKSVLYSIQMESESFYGKLSLYCQILHQRCLLQVFVSCGITGKNVVRKRNLTIVPLPGVTLSEKEPIAQFDVPEIPEEYVVHSHKLIIKQISLGEDAKTGEFNVVQVCAYMALGIHV